MNIETKLVSNSLEKLYIVKSIANSIKTYGISKGFLMKYQQLAENIPAFLNFEPPTSWEKESHKK